MNDQELNEIEITIEAARAEVNKMEALMRLLDNKDFKEIVEEGYFVKEASRLVLLKSDPEMQSAEMQKQLDNSIIAVGSLRQYFRTVIQMGRMAERSIKADEMTREELLAEAM